MQQHCHSVNHRLPILSSLHDFQAAESESPSAAVQSRASSRGVEDLDQGLEAAESQCLQHRRISVFEDCEDLEFDLQNQHSLARHLEGVRQTELPEPELSQVS